MFEKLQLKIKNKKLIYALMVIFVIGISLVQYYTIEVGYRRDINAIIMMKPMHQVSGLIITLTLNAILILIIKNIKASLMVSSTAFSVFAVINHYVTILHGTPFNILMVKNLKTAADVLTNYKIEIDVQVVYVLVLFALQLAVILVMFGKTKVKRIITLPVTVVMVCLLVVFYGIKGSVIPRDATSWSWDAAIAEYGYTSCFVSNCVQSMNVPVKPAEYDEQAVENYVNSFINKEEGTNTPDIILILNESFYDLNQITDINTDVDYLSYINSLENSVTGYAVVPNAGGGTNRSEYELLTSNSLATNTNITPFNDLDIAGTNSVVSYLEAKGYSTLGTHPYTSANYMRNSAYPGIGFDYVYFDTDFTDTDYYYNRHYVTDESVYKNMLRWYEEMPQGPRFMYMLTIQNHAAYTHDEPEHDIVHTQNDYGEKTEEINEYLTSMYVSDRAFETLVEYYKDSDRDVIICMVGDHAPAFAKNYIDENYSAQEAEIRIRSTPYVIWSNNIDLTETDSSKYERISLNYLTPVVMELAGMDLSGYYEYLTELRNDIPVITNFGVFVTKDGKTYSYEEDSEYKESVDLYFDLCYANMKNREFMKEYAN
ncbi:MAG: LTA synthase family protein [Ruminococcaceae bacterium]|nr:LTA synthase family protein [Oscillospiraceae bacterium]